MQRFEAGKIRISKSLKERESLDNRGESVKAQCQEVIALCNVKLKHTH